MKLLITTLIILLTCALPGVAQASSADVPPNTWPWVAVETIEKAGIPLGHPEGTYGGNREMTRSVFTVATGNLLVNLNLLSASPLVPDNGFRGNYTDLLRRSPCALNALIALTTEFAPELGKLNWDAPKATSRLEALQERQRRDVRAGKIVLTPEQWSSPFADVPQTDPACHNQDTLQKSGIVMGQVDGTWSGYPPETRLQTATQIARLFAQMAPLSDLAGRIQQSPQDVPALRSLVREFTPELNLLAQDVDAYQSRLAALAPPPRVLPEHLAAYALADIGKHVYEMTVPEYRAVRHYIDRRWQLPPLVQQTSAMRLAVPLMQRLGIVPPAGVISVNYADFLEYLAVAFEQYRGVK